MSHYQLGYTWPFLATPPNRPLLPADLGDYIMYRQLLYVDSSWSSCLCTSMWRGPQKYVTNEFIPTSPAVSHMSGSSDLDSFRDGLLVNVQLLLREVLPPGCVQYCTQHSCLIAVKLFSIRLVSVHVVHPYSCIDTTAFWKKLCFILSVRSDFQISMIIPRIYLQLIITKKSIYLLT